MRAVPNETIVLGAWQPLRPRTVAPIYLLVNKQDIACAEGPGTLMLFASMRRSSAPPKKSKRVPAAREKSKSTRRKPRTQRERTETSKADLLGAALELIAERGYRGTSLAAIGERAGYSRGLVTEHFGSKDGLLRELVSRLMTGWRNAVLAEDIGDKHGVPAMVAVVHAHRRSLDRAPSRMRALYVLLFESVLELTSVKDEFKKMDAELIRLAVHYLREAQKAGTVRADVDAEAQATLAIAVIRGITMQWMVDPKAMNLDRVYAELARWMTQGLSVD
jgi:AcrR family transcriptional regulator